MSFGKGYSEVEQCERAPRIRAEIYKKTVVIGEKANFFVIKAFPFFRSAVPPDECRLNEGYFRVKHFACAPRVKF